MELTKEFQQLTSGHYEKEMQDVRLLNGDIITKCWPNAGFWNILGDSETESNGKYKKKEILVEYGQWVRLTHDKIWYQ